MARAVEVSSSDLLLIKGALWSFHMNKQNICLHSLLRTKMHCVYPWGTTGTCWTYWTHFLPHKTFAKPVFLTCLKPTLFRFMFTSERSSSIVWPIVSDGLQPPATPHRKKLFKIKKINHSTASSLLSLGLWHKAKNKSWDPQSTSQH